MFKPTTFGKFYLYEKLAIGGMAEIFKAKLYGIAGFEKTLVVKQILPEYAVDDEFVKMFIDEANIAVSLTHGNIVPIYELGKIGERYYIAMEYVDGENLETVVDQCKRHRIEIPISICVEIAIEICKGLDYAHKKLSPTGEPLGIVHRDVSPQNVMLSFDGEVKIVDFGIAKAASKLSLTRVGTLKGKFGYMSPEQAMGGEVDGRSDVYAAGIVLYEMLTGTTLYEAENDMELIKRVRAAAVLPPRLVSARVPEELDRIAMKALAKSVGERYGQAGQFQLELQRWLYSRKTEEDDETVSNFMRRVFRREGAQPAPSGVANMPLPLAERETSEIRKRREVSFARNDEIGAVLENARIEARKVMLDDPGSVVPAEESEEREDTSTSPNPDSNPEFSDSPSFAPEVLESTGEVSRSSTSESPDTIEWDETTDHKLVERASAGNAGFLERNTTEGPIIRIPKTGAVPDPPWQAGGMAPEGGGSEETRLGGPPTVRGRAAPSSAGPKSQTGALPAVVPEAPISNPSESSLFPGRRGGAGGRLFMALAILVLAGIGGTVWMMKDRAAAVFSSVPVSSPTSAPTAANAAVTPFPQGTDEPEKTAPSPAPPRTVATTAAAAISPVRPTPRRTTIVRRTPKPAPTRAPVIAEGTISIQAIPWGEVTIDGKRIGNTPVFQRKMPAGKHKVVVSNPEFPDRTHTTELTVRANVDEETIIVTFE